MSDPNNNGQGIQLVESESLSIGLAREKRFNLMTEADRLDAEADKLKAQAKQKRDEGQAILQITVHAVFRDAALTVPDGDIRIIDNERKMPAWLSWRPAAPVAAPVPAPAPAPAPATPAPAAPAQPAAEAPPPVDAPIAAPANGTAPPARRPRQPVPVPFSVPN